MEGEEGEIKRKMMSKIEEERGERKIQIGTKTKKREKGKRERIIERK